MTPLSNQTRLGLIRHAPTMWNEVRRIQGQQDSRLSERGRELACTWGKQLQTMDWHRIVCSDLGRARETTALVNRSLKLPLHGDLRLREQDWGQWTGMSLTEVKRRCPVELHAQERRGWHFRPAGGESRLNVLERALAALADIHHRWPSQAVLVITHEGVIKCVLYHLLNRQFLPEEPAVINRNCLHLLAADSDTLTLDSLNHLSLASEPGELSPSKSDCR